MWHQHRRQSLSVLVPHKIPLSFDTITGLNPWKKDKGIIGAMSTFAAAQTAITVGAGATYPFDTVRRRLQMQSEKPVEQHIYKGRGGPGQGPLQGVPGQCGP